MEPGATDLSPEQNGGLLKVIKRPGPDPEDKPFPGDRVKVHYTGTLLSDGSKFDSSVDRNEKFEFNLGKGEVIKGWDLGVASMAKGELAVFTITAPYAYGSAGSPPKIPADATLVFEIELFSFEGEDITKVKDGGIIRRIRTNGQGFDYPNDGGMVEVNLVGRCNGVVFDERQKLSFVLGEGEELGIPRGLEMALEKMKRNECSHITISHRYAFGKNGQPEKKIPGNAKVSYDVELLNFERCKDNWQLNGDEKLEACRMFKEKGTMFYSKGKYDLAVNKYRKVIDYLEHEVSLKDDQETERKSLLQAGRLNMAICLLKKGDWIEARNMCSKVLEENPGVVKAYFRRGEALIHLKDYDEAKQDFQRVLDSEPDNKAAMAKIQLCIREIRNLKTKEKQLFANMFDKFARQDVKKAQEERDKEKPVEIGQWQLNRDAGDGMQTEAPANGHKEGGGDSGHVQTPVSSVDPNGVLANNPDSAQDMENKVKELGNDLTSFNVTMF